MILLNLLSMKRNAPNGVQSTSTSTLAKLVSTEDPVYAVALPIALVSRARSPSLATVPTSFQHTPPVLGLPHRN